MNLAETLDQLHKARRYVNDGEKCMVRQREVVVRLERRGRDPLNAIEFLEYLEEMQNNYVAYRDRLEKQVLSLVMPAAD
jgi:hypothetical protein